ncbi:cysteine motif gene-d9.1 [Ichnoviriform fugitivi]|uniref:Cysteine motif gene-d9.1 n=1 Tax=Ichnoviriform fugitivi TaxID=265522 RepID=A2Q0M1_9VIRU|nr:cysteine motif gene-d9.1 [Ichnoviriform fugitivi]BAF45736.1 cysteine motif gene-d9.1 [Ichnoviriform fugitivi]
MGWSMDAWVLTMTAMAVAAGRLKIPRSMCIPQGSYCMDTVKPCCQPVVLNGFHVRHYERICFIFGQGLCQPFYEIPQVELYVQLVRKLNSTNYMELRRQYRRNLDMDPDAELVDSRLLKSLKSDDYPTTIFTKFRAIPSQMVRNNIARNLTDTNVISAQMVRNETATKLTDSRIIPVQMVPNEKAIELTDSNVIPTQIVPNETATKLTDSRIIPVQMVPNEKATELTDSNVIPTQIVHNETVTKLTDSTVNPAPSVHYEVPTKVAKFPLVPVHVIGKNIPMKNTQHYSPYPTIPVSKKPPVHVAPMAWSRY